MWKYASYDLKGLGSPYDVLDEQYPYQRHIYYYWDETNRSAHHFTAINIRQSRKNEAPDGKLFIVELALLNPKEAENFLAYCKHLADNHHYMGPQPVLTENRITMDATHLNQVYQLMLVAALYDASLKKTVFEDMKKGFQPLYQEEDQSARPLASQQMPETSQTQSSIASAYPHNSNAGLKAYDAILVARGLQIIRAHAHNNAHDLGNSDKRIEALRKVITSSTAKSTRFKPMLPHN